MCHIGKPLLVDTVTLRGCRSCRSHRDCQGPLGAFKGPFGLIRSVSGSILGPLVYGNPNIHEQKFQFDKLHRLGTRSPKTGAQFAKRMRNVVPSASPARLVQAFESFFLHASPRLGEQIWLQSPGDLLGFTCNYKTLLCGATGRTTVCRHNTFLFDVLVVLCTASHKASRIQIVHTEQEGANYTRTSICIEDSRAMFRKDIQFLIMAMLWSIFNPSPLGLPKIHR